MYLLFHSQCSRSLEPDTWHSPRALRAAKLHSWAVWLLSALLFESVQLRTFIHGHCKQGQPCFARSLRANGPPIHTAWAWREEDLGCLETRLGILTTELIESSVRSPSPGAWWHRSTTSIIYFVKRAYRLSKTVQNQWGFRSATLATPQPLTSSALYPTSFQ